MAALQIVPLLKLKIPFYSLTELQLTDSSDLARNPEIPITLCTQSNPQYKRRPRSQR